MTTSETPNSPPPKEQKKKYFWENQPMPVLHARMEEIQREYPNRISEAPIEVVREMCALFAAKRRTTGPKKEAKVVKTKSGPPSGITWDLDSLTDGI